MRIPSLSPAIRTLRSALAPIAVALLIAPAIAPAQEPAALNFAYSTTVFALDDTSSLVELDYQYSDRGLIYKRVDGRTIGQLMVSFVVRDSTGIVILDNAWITTSAEPDKGDEDHALLGVKLFGLRPGTHRAQIAYEDVNAPEHRDSAEFTLTVRKFGPRLALSDVQVISEITPSEETSNRFYKNGYIIYPNVLSAIEPPFLLLNTYLEIYNAHLAPTSQYEIIYALADSVGTPFFQKEEKRDRPTAPAVIDVHSLVLDELPSGSYYLLVKVFSGLRGTASDSATVVRPFTILNPDKDAQLAASGGASTSTTSGATEIDPLYAGLNEPELETEFALLKHISIEREREIWKGLTGKDAKARFLTEFWSRRDPNPSTPLNEFREEYQRRIEGANALYREPLVEHGYQSDRGRVMLQYGKPDQVDRHYYDKNRRPFEIWTFSKDNLTFVFVDRSGMGRFVLVHSDAPGEVRQENWERLYATVHEYMDN